MTKNDWLQICRLNQEWYFRSNLDNPSDEWIKEHMPGDDIFDDGRIEFFQKNFKPEIDEEKLEELANEQKVTIRHLYSNSSYRELTDLEKDIYKEGYRTGKQ